MAFLTVVSSCGTSSPLKWPAGVSAAHLCSPRLHNPQNLAAPACPTGREGEEGGDRKERRKEREEKERDREEKEGEREGRREKEGKMKEKGRRVKRITC